MTLLAVPTLMLATGNLGKVAELSVLLALHPGLADVALLTPRDWPHPLTPVEETGATFEENALLKARALAGATGLPALADDSGLCVDALGGRPGLHSARWAGPDASDADRNLHLLSALAPFPDPRDRAARFVCAVAVVLPTGEEAIGRGECGGVILDAARGSGGFGYDPLFLLPDLGRTMAELTSDRKNARSHRARAVAGLAPRLARLLSAV